MFLWQGGQALGSRDEGNTDDRLESVSCRVGIVLLKVCGTPGTKRIGVFNGLYRD